MVSGRASVPLRREGSAHYRSAGLLFDRHRGNGPDSRCFRLDRCRCRCSIYGEDTWTRIILQHGAESKVGTQPSVEPVPSIALAAGIVAPWMEASVVAARASFEGRIAVGYVAVTQTSRSRVELRHWRDIGIEPTYTFAPCRRYERKPQTAEEQHHPMRDHGHHHP